MLLVWTRSGKRQIGEKQNGHHSANSNKTREECNEPVADRIPLSLKHDASHDLNASRLDGGNRQIKNEDREKNGREESEHAFCGLTLELSGHINREAIDWSA